MSTSSSTDPGGSLRYFSGNDEDPKEYVRWKTWVQNKLMTLDKLPASAKGAYIYTLLSGRALDCVEHLEPESYQKEGGDQVLWELLDRRFPKKDQADELGELLGEVFQLQARDGETCKTWIARATELFDRLERKTKVTFPTEARGWILLRRAHLSSEQQAVVLARAQGSLQRDTVSAAMRSCYPDMVLRPKKLTSVHAVVHEPEDIDELLSDEPAGDEFQDVEAMLAEHAGSASTTAADSFAEDEVAEVLAVTWKERRAELSKLQKSRKFHAAKELKRSFRIEVEELKRRTTCRRCGKQGHWARECPEPRTDSGKGAGKGSGAKGAAYVETQSFDFIAYVQPQMTMVQRLEAQRFQSSGASPEDMTIPNEVMLVSSPGYGVLDSGCGRTIVGQETLKSFEQLWKSRGMSSPKVVQEINSFRYGNGETELTDKVVHMPVTLAGKRGIITAAVVRGQAPLLISRSALQSLNACIDFGRSEIKLFKEQSVVPLTTNAAGQFVLPLLSDVTAEPVEVSHVSDPSDGCAAVTMPTEVHNVIQESDAVDEVSEPIKHCWIREDWGITHAPTHTPSGPKWENVSQRIVKDGSTGRVLFHDVIKPHTSRKQLHRAIPSDVKHVVSEFQYTGEEIPPTECCSVQQSLSVRQQRQIESQLKQCQQAHEPNRRSQKVMVVEVFSPPRFSQVCNELGFRARSYDIVTGQDLSIASNRAEVKQSIRDDPPELLILCPPCTNESGWFFLNSAKGDRVEYLRKMQQSREFIRFCVSLFKLQVSLGGRALFEHPAGAKTWKYPEVEKLVRQYHLITCHMCCYGLGLPQSSSKIRKSTKLLLSHEDMKVLERKCTGDHEHDVVAGSHPSVGQISKYVAQYTPQFVEAVLNTVPSFRNQRSPEVLELVEEYVSTDEQWCEVLAIDKPSEASDEELRQAVLKVHRNLGHPSNQDLIRILKHGQASERAVKIARELQCSFCQSRSQPKCALPAQTHRVTEFNEQIGIDVKQLPGWKVNQQVKALNIVDTASGFQRVIPFHETETSRLLWSLLQEHWISWAGPPKEIILDPAATNLGEPMVVPLENQGVHIRPIAADAHYQLGKTESHGKWFERVVDRILTEHSPQNKEEWTECVTQAHVKNSMIHNHGVTPHQFVFGRDPRLPSDLMDEPANVVGQTVALTESAVAKAQEIRTSARRIVVPCDLHQQPGHGSHPNLLQVHW